jgi:hypothetical protein
MRTLASGSVSHEPRELLQRLGAPDLRAAHAAELDRLPACGFELGIGERLERVECAPVTMVARVEAVLGDELRESQGFTRHG